MKVHARSVAAMLCLLGGMFCAVIPAAAQPAPVVTLTVVKVINDTFPANTVFRVNVICDLDDPNNDVNTTLSFSANGSPIGSNTIGLNENDGTCRIIETGTGGAASVTFACDDNTNAVDPSNPNGSTCAGLNAQGEFVVDYDVVVVDGVAATVTITNTGPRSRVAAVIPTMDEIGLAGTVLALAIFGVLTLRRRQRERTGR